MPWPSTDNSARACSDCLVFIELIRVGESKCLYGERFVRLVGCPTIEKGCPANLVWAFDCAQNGLAHLDEPMVILACNLFAPTVIPEDC